MSVKKSVLLAAALLSAGIAGTAAKAEGPAETRYLELEQAIAAQERCMFRPFTQDQATALNQRVMTLVGTPLSASVKLTLIEAAKRNVQQHYRHARLRRSAARGVTRLVRQGSRSGRQPIEARRDDRTRQRP